MTTERFPHSLKHVKSARGPSQIATIDARLSIDGLCSWYAIIERLEGGKWTRRAERAGNSPAEWWEWLWTHSRIDRCTWVFSANWPRVASAIGLVAETSGGSCEVGKAALTQRAWWVQLDHRGRHVELVSATNWWSDLPDSIVVNPARGLTQDDACRLTCERLHRMVTESVAACVAAKLGVIQPTMGSWAANVWRHWHKGTPARVHCNDDALRLERQSFAGGEVIARREGRYKGPFWGVDVNGLFPASMAEWTAPRSLIEVLPSITVAELLELPYDHGAIAAVDLESPGDTYPTRQDGQRLCATGRLSTVLAWPELLSACEMGHIRRVGQTAIYHTSDLFGPWAQLLWNHRQSMPGGPKSPGGKLCKALAVALYGWCGKHRTEWVDCDEPCVEPWSWWVRHDGEQVQHYHAIGERVQRRDYQSGLEPFDSLPSIAAWTTSAARLHMAGIRQVVGDRHWLYQYIDTLVVDETGMQRLDAAGLVDRDRLGYLRVDWTCEMLEIRGPGWLVHDERRRIAGVGVDATSDGVDAYTLSTQTSPAGWIGGHNPGTYSEAPRKIHYERPARIGTLTGDGWVDPPCLRQW